MMDLDRHNKYREEYNPEGSEMRDLQMTALGILLEFDRICNKHNIKYILSSGTLLGAVRHGGFVPWDDDVDVEMLSTEYKKLMRVLDDELPDIYETHSNSNDAYYTLSFMKIRHKEKMIHGKHKSVLLFNKNGIFIDVFVVKKSSKVIFQIARAVLDFMVRRPLLRKILPKWRMRLAWGFVHNAVYPLLNLIDKFIPGKLRYTLGNVFRETKEKSYFVDIIKIDFEGYPLSAPREYKDYLTTHFGDYNEVVIYNHTTL